MTRFEDLVSETLRERALDIPDGAAQPIRQGAEERTTHHLRTVLISVAAASLLVAGFAVVRANVTETESSEVASAIPDIRGLTGKAVGDALGLEPTKWPVPGGCRAFAEYDNPWGFCYEQLTFGPPTDVGSQADAILGRQINGQVPSAAEADYLAAILELKAMTDGTIEYDADREADLKGLIADFEGHDATPQPLSEETIATLGRRGIRVSLLDPERVQPQISANQARVTMREEASSEPSEMSLATVTVDDYLDKSGRRIIEDRLVWVGLFPDRDVFLSGPIQGSDDRPPSYKADMTVMIDATTGKFLRAETIN